MLARAATIAVVIRRGPNKQLCVLGWNRCNDTSQVGQGLRGRIHERRCELSPDVRRLVYFAMNGR